MSRSARWGAHSAHVLGFFVMSAQATNTYDQDRVPVYAPPSPHWAQTCSPWCPWERNDHQGLLWRSNPGAPQHNSRDWLDASPCEKETSANPIVLSSGNKVERERDFTSSGEMGLFLERTYNNYWGHVGLFGGHWLSNFDYALTFGTDNSEMWAQRPDGRRIQYLLQGSTNRIWRENKAGAVSYIERLDDGQYLLYREDGGRETYLSPIINNKVMHGMPIASLRNRQGVGWNLVAASPCVGPATTQCLSR